MVTILAIVVLGGGSALAATQLAKNSVGPRQLKSKAVTTGKIAPNAVNGTRVANGSLSGADINLAALGTVPSATDAAHAKAADTVGGHAAACPAGTILTRGACFDAHSEGEAANVLVAADACAAKGGYLPSPLQLYAVRDVINLGTGVGTDAQFTDIYYYDASTGSSPSTVTVDGTGAITQVAASSPANYTCAYSLLR
jgi:hypothetical protein